MILQPHETERFYRIWFALLSYANRRLKLVDDLPASPRDGSIGVQDAYKVASAVWADDALRHAFADENPAGLPAEDLALVRSWDRRISGDFYVFRYLKKYTVLINQGGPTRVYGILGLVSPIEEVMFAPPPVLVRMTLLPFEGRITYDGIVAPYNVYFGGGIRSSLNDSYRSASERGAIITSLDPPAPAELPQLRAEIAKRNEKLLVAYRRDLAQANLSMKMVEQHTANIEAFANDYLLAQAAPRGLLDLTADDISAYLARQASLTQAARKVLVTSFKRFTRFLYDTGRLDWEVERVIRDRLKLLG